MENVHLLQSTSSTEGKKTPFTDSLFPEPDLQSWVCNADAFGTVGMGISQRNLQIIGVLYQMGHSSAGPLPWETSCPAGNPSVLLTSHENLEELSHPTQRGSFMDFSRGGCACVSVGTSVLGLSRNEVNVEGEMETTPWSLRSPSVQLGFPLALDWKWHLYEHLRWKGMMFIE